MAKRADATLTHKPFRPNYFSVDVIGESHNVASPTPNSSLSMPPIRQPVENISVIKSRSHSGSDFTISPRIPPRGTSSSLTEPSDPHQKNGLKREHIYPALLSRVASQFRSRTTLRTHTKDGLDYKNCFTGREAIETLCQIIRTSDRNLALLLGRALDARKFFHDVTYDLRLRDSSNELYRFNESSRQTSFQESRDYPNGVFTLLTRCYSPTCSKRRPCYSVSCPRRFEKHPRVDSSGGHELRHSASKESISEKTEEQPLWINTVPAGVAESLSKAERKRQEIVFEVIYTEKDFVRDLEVLIELYMKPLSREEIIAESSRDLFVETVFGNAQELHSIMSRLSAALQRRQSNEPIVFQIGDVYLSHVYNFEAFVEYGVQQVYAKDYLDEELRRNPELQHFVEETERKPESRKLTIHSFLSRPTTRLGRYLLLLEAVVKHSPENHPDRADLPKVIDVVKEFLSKINVECGRASDKLKLQKLSHQLLCRPGDLKELRLLDEQRKVIREGVLKKRSNVEQMELNVFLLDHILLLTKLKRGKDGSPEYKIHKKPIPLELLSFGSNDDVSSRATADGKPAASNAIVKASSLPTTAARLSGEKAGFPMTVLHLGRNGHTHVLYAQTETDRQQWREHIEKQRETMAGRHSIFAMKMIDGSHFTVLNKINCFAIYSSRQKALLGTETGLYSGEIASRSFQKLLSMDKISQVEVVEDASLFLVLSDRVLYSFPYDMLAERTPHLASTKRGRKISSHVSFFKVGECLGRRFICLVKSTSLSTTIRVLEPMGTLGSKKRPTKNIFTRTSSDYLRTFKEFYIPSESFTLYFLKNKLCVGCAKGFEIVDLNSLGTQGLLDPDDELLSFVLKREEDVRPIAIFRVDGDFLVCYDEFGFFVNKNGRRSRLSWLVRWEGEPSAFALEHPYILAFSSTFIEVRNVESGLLEQVIQTANLRVLRSEPREIYGVVNPLGSHHQHLFCVVRHCNNQHP